MYSSFINIQNFARIFGCQDLRIINTNIQYRQSIDDTMRINFSSQTILAASKYSEKQETKKFTKIPQKITNTKTRRTIRKISIFIFFTGEKYCLRFFWNCIGILQGIS